MPLNDPLAACLSKIMNAERVSKTTCLIKPSSKIIKKVLEIMNENMYIGQVKEIQESRGNHLEVDLIQKINNCNVIKPRFNVKNKLFEKYEKRYLPAKDFGIIVVSTSLGIMTHKEAKKKGIGGKLIAYCY